MISLLVALVVAQPATFVTNTKADTKAVATRCVNAAGTAFESCGGAGGAGVSYVNALIDGGWMTVTVLNPTPAYVNALLDGGWVTTTVLNPALFTNVMVDGGAVVATQGTSRDGGYDWGVSANLDRVGGNAIGTTLPIQFDGGWVSALSSRTVGNTGAVLDAANNGAAPANVFAVGGEAATQGTTQPAAATAGNMRRHVLSTDGVQYVRQGGPVAWSCFVQAATVTTQCRAAPAAGIRAYVMSFSCSNQAATVQTVDIVFGTGAACVTGITALTHKLQMGTVATTTSPFESDLAFSSPLVPTAANAICVRPSAATAFGCTLTGFDAP